MVQTKKQKQANLAKARTVRSAKLKAEAKTKAETKALAAAERAKVVAAAILLLEPIAAKINAHLAKGDDHRLAAALELENASKKAKEAGINFKEWVGKNVKWSYESVRKLVAIGRSDNPQKAIEDLRHQNKQANKQHRAKKRAVASSNALAASDPFKAVENLAAQDAEPVMKKIEKIVGDYGFGLASDADVKELKRLRAKPEKITEVDLAMLKIEFTRMKPADRMAFLRYASDYMGMILVDPTAETPKADPKADEEKRKSEHPPVSDDDLDAGAELVRNAGRRRRRPAEAQPSAD